VNPLAFGQLMRRYNRKLYRAARAILRDDAAAEDAVQESWLHAYRAIDQFRGEAQLGTWLVRIAINEALARRRREAHAGVAAPAAEPLAREEDGPEAMARQAELRRTLQAQIDALAPVFRAVFILRAVQELSVGETAAVLRIPEATVRTRFFRARRQLRAVLS
jgi:RNA polymerase sigma-70 factor (ECF subfamily)